MKFVIPAILAGTVLVAGMFALMPVQKATTLHLITSTPANFNEKDTLFSGTIAGPGTFIVVAAEAGKTIKGQAVLATTSIAVGTTCALQDTGATVLIAAVAANSTSVANIDSGAGIPAGFTTGEGLQVVAAGATARCALTVNQDSAGG